MQTEASDWQQRIDAVWNDERLSPEQTVERISALAAELPATDARGPFELGGAFDSAGHEAEAAEHYARAVELGLAGRARAELDIQYASTLRNLGRFDDAVAMLQNSTDHPDLGASRSVFLALALHSAGRPGEALATALEALAPTLPRYQRSVRGYAAELRAAGQPAEQSGDPAFPASTEAAV